MDILKIIQSVEGLAYEICMWFLLIPKTIWKIVKPQWVLTYVKEELLKEEKKQFQEYLSPMLLWVLTVAIPTFILIRYEVHDIGIDNPIVNELMGKSVEVRILIVCTFLIVSPLLFAVVIQRLAKKPITREGLKENFYIQIYAFVPLQSFTIGSIYSMTTIAQDTDSLMSNFMIIIYAPLAIFGLLYNYWFIYYEVYIIRKLLNIKWWKSIFIFILFSIVAVFLTVIIMLYLLSLIIPDPTIKS